MVDFKYKVTDIAKDFGISTKKVIETFAELTGETRKTGATFEENEVNALMEALTRETAVKDLGEYLASGKEPHHSFFHTVIAVQQLAGFAANSQCTQQWVLIIRHGASP